MCQPFYLITLYHSQRTRIAFLFLVHISGYDYVRYGLCPFFQDDIVLCTFGIDPYNLVAISQHYRLEGPDAVRKVEGEASVSVCGCAVSTAFSAVSYDAGPCYRIACNVGNSSGNVPDVLSSNEFRRHYCHQKKQQYPIVSPIVVQGHLFLSVHFFSAANLRTCISVINPIKW